MNKTKTHVVLDTGFGDAGKGVVVDNLCQSLKSLVVRFSGGQQCGHTVIRNGIKHVCSNFGSGVLQGSPTYFTEDTTFFPKSFAYERDILASKGIYNPKVILHPLTLITTMYDVAFNRAKENQFIRHGSCGMGIAATMKRNLETHYNLYAIDIQNIDIYKQKHIAIGNYYNDLIDTYSSEFQTEYWDQISRIDEGSTYSRIEALQQMVNITNINRDQACEYESIIFEGSQGIQLDMHHGIFPNVTYANTTSKNAIKYLKKWGLIDNTFLWYVSRCYGTRHGRGWTPNDIPVELINNEEEINVYNPYQQDFKVFEFDKSIVEQSIAIDSIYSGDYVSHKNVVITCVDQRPGWEVPKIKGIDMMYLNSSAQCGSMREHKIWDEH